MELLVATTNRGKLAEIGEVLKSLPVRIFSLDALDGAPGVVEDGKTFEENALKKARALAAFSGRATLADDSGLEVAALGGAPGVHSARYGGQYAQDALDAQIALGALGAADRLNNEKLLRELSGVADDQRGARFVCVLALCAPAASGGGEWLFRAECHGAIAFAPRGDNGFGYDPLFFYPPLGRTFGELDGETKGRVSHRGQALKKFVEAFPSLPIFSKNLRG